MRSKIGLTVLTLALTAAPAALYAQDDAAKKAGNATEEALDKAGGASETGLKKAGQGVEEGLEATGDGVGAAVEHTTRGAVKTGKAIAGVFSADDDRRATEERVKAAQRALAAKGYYGGEIDGVIGPKTRSGIREFQDDEGLPKNGKLNEATLARLEVK